MSMYRPDVIDLTPSQVRNRFPDAYEVALEQHKELGVTHPDLCLWRLEKDTEDSPYVVEPIGGYYTLWMEDVEDNEGGSNTSLVWDPEGRTFD